MPPTNLDTVALLLPELIVAGTGALIFMCGPFLRGRWWYALLSLIGLAVAAGWLSAQHAELVSRSDASGRVVSGPLVWDAFAQFVRWIGLAMGAAFVLVSAQVVSRRLAAEYLGSLLLVTSGSMLVGTASDLVLLFVALELISIPTYMLLIIGRSDLRGWESTAKYFYLSILSSALLLLGFSVLYGVTGATHLDVMRAALSVPPSDASAGMFALTTVGCVFLLSGLGFKLAAVPFHFYAPDVYQGTSSGNAGLLSVIPKAAGIVALVRLLEAALPSFGPSGWQVLLAMAIVTMTLGNAVALWQRNMRRMMAYSSIAHAGYLLIGLAVMAASYTTDAASHARGISAALLYLLVYALATVGTFAALAFLASERSEVDGIDELAGLHRTHPLIAVSIALFMFSLTGLPPLAGFWGKLGLIVNALAVDIAPSMAQAGMWFVTLAVAAVLNAALSAGYYLRVVGTMYFAAPRTPLRAEGRLSAGAVTLGCGIAVLAIGLLPRGVLHVTAEAGAAARRPAANETQRVADDVAFAVRARASP